MPLTCSEKVLKVKPSSTFEITDRARELKSLGHDVISFGAGEPDFNTPANINEAAIKAIHQGFTKYTAVVGTLELRLAIADKFKKFNKLYYAPDQIVVSNGGKHSLTNIFQVLINPGDEVIIPVPYWLTYPEIVKLCGGVPVFVYGKKENGYHITAQQVKEAVTEKTKALIVNTPNNPGGMVYSEEDLRAIAQVAVDGDFYVVADEMYEMLTYGDHAHISIASLGKEIYERTITCSGLSKSYAMTGWRIGYTGSSEKIAKMMGSIQSHQTSNPCSIAQKAAEEALKGDQGPIEVMIQEFARRKEYLYERMQALPFIECLEPQGAFYVLLDLSQTFSKKYHGKNLTSANQVAKILLDDFFVAVVPCADFGLPNSIRLSYATSMEAITKGADRIEAFMRQLQ